MDEQELVDGGLSALVGAGLTGIAIEVEFGADPVFALGSDNVVGVLSLDELDLSVPLIEALRAWSHDWECGLDERYEWRSHSAEAAWSVRGRALAARAHDEIGDQVEIFYSDGHGRRSLRTS